MPPRAVDIIYWSKLPLRFDDLESPPSFIVGVLYKATEQKRSDSYSWMKFDAAVLGYY